MKKRSIVYLAFSLIIIMIGIYSFEVGCLDVPIQVLNENSEKVEIQFAKDTIEMANYPQVFTLCYVKDRMSSGHVGNIDDNTALRVLAHYNILKGRATLEESNPEYVLDVLLIEWFNGNIDVVKEMMNDIDYTLFTEEYRGIYLLIKSNIHIAMHELEDALSALDSIDNSNYFKYREKIKEFIGKFYDDSVKYKTYSNVGVGDRDNPYLQYVREILDAPGWMKHSNRIKSKPNRKLKGRMTINGQPFEGVFMFFTNYSGLSILDAFSDNTAVTDANGEFELEYNDEDYLELGMAAPWHRINDKQYKNILSDFRDVDYLNIDFVDGARLSDLKCEGDKLYYKIVDVNANESRKYALRVSYVDKEFDVNGDYIGEIKLLEGELDLTKVRNELNPSYGRIFYSGETLTIEMLLAPLYKSAYYNFDVIIHEEGKHITNGTFNNTMDYTIFIKGNELNDGDLLVKENRIEEAIKWYEQDDSIHSLKCLISIYKKGYIPMDEDSMVLGGQDINKAIFYENKLIDLYGESESRLLALVSMYKDIEDYNRVWDVLQRLDDRYPSNYIKKQMAWNLVHRGLYLDGIKHYSEYVDAEDNKWDVSLLLLGDIRDKLPKDFETMVGKIDSLDSYGDFTELIRDGQYKLAWDYLDRQEESDIKSYYRLLMMDVLDNSIFDYKKLVEEGSDIDRFMDYYIVTTNNLKDENLKDILKELKNGCNWFRYDKDENYID